LLALDENSAKVEMRFFLGGTGPIVTELTGSGLDVTTVFELAVPEPKLNVDLFVGALLITERGDAAPGRGAAVEVRVPGGADARFFFWSLRGAGGGGAVTGFTDSTTPILTGAVVGASTATASRVLSALDASMAGVSTIGSLRERACVGRGGANRVRLEADETGSSPPTSTHGSDSAKSAPAAGSATGGADPLSFARADTDVTGPIADVNLPAGISTSIGDMGSGLMGTTSGVSTDGGNVTGGCGCTQLRKEVLRPRLG